MVVLESQGANNYGKLKEKKKGVIISLDLKQKSKYIIKG